MSTTGREATDVKTKVRKDFFTEVSKTWRKLKRLQITGVRGQCCGGCSANEGGHRMDADPELVGYAYYHVQDRESVEAHGTLYVGFGARGGDDKKAEIIGQQIFMLFVMDGFAVEWNRSSNTRLKLSLPGEQ
jgi:hypothetical protein